MGSFLDKYKIKEEEEQEPFSFLNKYKPQVGLGVDAKATGGISLPETTPEIKPLIEGLPISKPEDKPKTLLEQIGVKKPTTPEELKMGIETSLGTWEEQKKANPELQKMEDLAKEVFSLEGRDIPLQPKDTHFFDIDIIKKGGSYTKHEAQIAYLYELLTATEDKAGVPFNETIKDMQFNKIKYGSINPPKDWKKSFKEEGILKTAIIGPSDKYGQAESVLQGLKDIVFKKENPGLDYLSSFGMKGFLLLMGGQFTDLLLNANFKVKNVKFNEKELTGVFRRAREALDPETGKLSSNLSDNDYYVMEQMNTFLKATNKSPAAREMLEKIVEQTGGLTFPQKVGIFGTKLYAGLPADEIAKSWIATQQLTKEMIQSLDPVKVSQVTQQLLNTSPALASAFLKAVEKPEIIPPEPAKVTPPAEPKEVLKAEVKEPDTRPFAKLLDLDKLANNTYEIKPSDRAKGYYDIFFKGTDKLASKFVNTDIKTAKTVIDNKMTDKIRKIFTGEKTPEQGEVKLKEKFKEYLKEEPQPTTITPAPAVEPAVVKKEAVVEPTPKVAPAIPTELERLAEEARKYGSAEEFEKAVSKVMAKKNQFGGLSNTSFTAKLTKAEKNLFNAHIEGKLGLHQLTDFYTQATQAKPAEAVTEKPAVVEAPALVKEEVKAEVELATPTQINKSYSIAKSRAMVSEEGKLKPQYRQIAEAMTGKRYIEKMTPEEAEMFIDSLNRLPEPKYRNGKLVPPSIPRTMKLTTEGFFQKKYGEPTPIWLLTDQTYYAEKLGIKSLVEPFEKGKQEFDLEFRKSSNLVDRMVNKLNQVAKTPGFEIIKSKFKNIPTKAESKMAGLLNKHETTPSGLSPKEEDVFKYFRNLSKDIWRRENEVREKLDLPPIKYKTAYFRHTADAMAKEMLEGKYPFPQGIKYWSEKMVGKKIFNPMEFHRKLSDDLIDLWSKDIRAVTKAMLWNGLKEIHLAQPAKFLNEQLNAISKDLPEYKNLTPAEQAAYEQTQVMPASTKKWLIDYINQVIKGQETELDASLNRIVTKSGLKGIFDKALSPFGRSVGRTPITHLFSLSGRMIISGTMGWVPRQIIRNAFQQVQNLALYGVQATIKSFLPASIDKNLKGLLSESLFMKSYTGFEELPTDLMGKLEKIWLQPYGIVAVNNAKQGMKASYWNILELIKNPKFKKYGWADPQRTKDTPKGFLYPSEEEKLLKEMEFGSSCTQYQYIPMGMPGVFRYKALIPLTRLQSWWMNYFAKFTREAIHRGLKGRPSWSGEDGPTLPWSRRVNWLKYLVIGGAILTAMGYRRSFLIGVLPTYLSPAGQVALGLYNYATATEDWQKKRALNQIYYSWKAFIPGSLAWRDFLAVWNGEKELEEILFYGKKEKEKIVKPTSPYLDKYKKETTVTPTSTYLNKYKK